MKTILCFFMLFVLFAACKPETVELKSPSGNIVVVINNSDTLYYTVRMNDKTVVNNSNLGLAFDGLLKPSANIKIVSESVREINTSYKTRGKHSEAIDHCNELVLEMKEKETGQPFRLCIRAYDDGVGIRYMVDDTGSFRITGEATQWRFPDGATAWMQDSEGKYMDRYKNDGFGSTGHHQAPSGGHQRIYQAMYFETNLNTISDSSMIGGPILLKFPDSGIYALMTEGALLNYPGSRYIVTQQNSFNLTFPEEEGWNISGPFSTPWRLLVLSDDLNGIVNTDMHTSVCPEPKDNLTDTDWIKPGRAVWSWYSGWTGDVVLQKKYVDWAAELGFEYNMIDGGWEKTLTSKAPYIGRDPWEVLKELADYASAKGIKTWIWQHSNNLKDPLKRKEYFEKMIYAGISGVKIDFFDAEFKVTVDYMTDILEEAADYKLLLNFHGTPKPTGLSRTYPHELCREANRGSEWHTKIWGGGRELTPLHNVITVFTRDVIGNNDFTVTIFDPVHLQGFTRTHQLAQAVCFTSPLTHWADQPHFYIESGVADIIKSIPTLWEKTLVLEPSDPGKLAAIARFDGKNWFVGVMNGEKTSREIVLNLEFLGNGSYNATLIGDDTNGDPVRFERIDKKNVTGHDKITVTLRPAGGYLARFTPTANL